MRSTVTSVSASKAPQACYVVDVHVMWFSGDRVSFVIQRFEIKAQKAKSLQNVYHKRDGVWPGA